jgi:hypothetical protein
LATGTVEEKIFQRQLSKEGLQSVVDDKEQVNALSTKDLKNLFKLRTGTPSDTHDKLRCDRCRIIQDNAEMESTRVLPSKLIACRALLDEMCQQQDASYFLAPLDPTAHGRTKEEYEKLVKQPMDFGVIRKKLDQPPGQSSAYTKISDFAKDVNRVFANIVKVWDLGDEIADASRRLQAWWVKKWTDLVPILMVMKADASEEGILVSADGAHDILEDSALVKNERGDDYQEQMGMPDEENMRAWSHHYSTDTVDDPIFRAAMRGTDAVSFVFGLEVTWSLIQERQQEEEARLAMDELNQVEELDDDKENVDDTNAAVEQCTANIPKALPCGNEEDELKEDLHSDEVDEGDEQAVDCEQGVEDDPLDEHDDQSTVDYLDLENIGLSSEILGSPSFARRDEALPSVETPCAEIVDLAESSPEGSTGEAQIIEATPEGSTAYAEIASSQSSNEMYPAKMQVSVPPPSNGEWPCPTCTLHNAKSRRKCSACGAKKSPASIKKRSLDQISS